MWRQGARDCTSNGEEINPSHRSHLILETKADPRPHPKLLSKEDSNKIIPKRVKENYHQKHVDSTRLHSDRAPLKEVLGGQYTYSEGGRQVLGQGT